MGGTHFAAWIAEPLLEDRASFHVKHKHFGLDPFHVKQRFCFGEMCVLVSPLEPSTRDRKSKGRRRENDNRHKPCRLPGRKRHTCSGDRLRSTGQRHQWPG